MAGRLRKSGWCKVYVGLAVIHTVASVAILVPNLINALKIGDQTIVNEEDPTEYPPKYFKVIMEVSAFMCLEIWRLWLALDSILQMNSLTIYASASFSVFSLAFSVFVRINEFIELNTMIVGSVRWLSIVDGVTKEIVHLKQVNLYIQIALCCVEFLLMIPTLYTAYKVIKEFGWQVYKKIGSSIELQKMYRTAQWFSLLLKIDVFFEVTFIFIVLFTKYYWYSSGTLQATSSPATSYMYTAVAFFLTLSIPLVREAIARESYWLINIFLLIQFIFLGFTTHYAYQSIILDDLINDWYAFYAYLSSVYLAGATTIVLTIMGLKPYVQWRKKKLNDAESLVALGNNQAQYKKMLDPIDDDD
ncbi:hypothetical protein MFLAVUS_000119 [Mucor flavus]|uniref:Uncharacterized protein n=1 Tax=Mucor flavus TaxID=439312 RepID=A0ABP9YIU8_9FUNG